MGWVPVLLKVSTPSYLWVACAQGNSRSTAASRLNQKHTGADRCASFHCLIELFVL